MLESIESSFLLPCSILFKLIARIQDSSNIALAQVGTTRL